MIAYWNGEFLPKASIRVSPDDRGFLFADGVYEVIRAYGGRPFAVTEHVARLRASLRGLRLEWPGADGLADVVVELLARNELSHEDALVYVQVTRGAAPRSHVFPPEGTPVTAYAAAWPYAPHDVADGAGAILVPDIRWARCDIKSVALLPNVLAQQEAREASALEAIFVRDGVLTEGTHTNVCVVLDGEVVTHPLTNHVLPGITRAAVRDLCRRDGIPWREAPVLLSEARRAQEILLVGTTVEVTAVVRLDGAPVADGSPGPVARSLAAAFERLVRA